MSAWEVPVTPLLRVRPLGARRRVGEGLPHGRQDRSVADSLVSRQPATTATDKADTGGADLSTNLFSIFHETTGIDAGLLRSWPDHRTFGRKVRLRGQAASPLAPARGRSYAFVKEDRLRSLSTTVSRAAER